MPDATSEDLRDAARGASRAGLGEHLPRCREGQSGVGVGHGVYQTGTFSRMTGPTCWTHDYGTSTLRELFCKTWLSAAYRGHSTLAEVRGRVATCRNLQVSPGHRPGCLCGVRRVYFGGMPAPCAVVGAPPTPSSSTAQRSPPNPIDQPEFSCLGWSYFSCRLVRFRLKPSIHAGSRPSPPPQADRATALTVAKRYIDRPPAVAQCHARLRPALRRPGGLAASPE